MVDCCTCRPRSCDSRNGNCACVERNYGGLPYVERVLVTRGSIVFECGGSCHCPADCKNKMIQTGLKFNFEVFKTVDCGWGLRSRDPIQAGSFTCEYAGDIIAKGEKEEDDYIFDGSRFLNLLNGIMNPSLLVRMLDVGTQ
ncbi:Histone-lysine N-methyltransferase, H3 lysine-9 specific SUVH7 [Cardamine amara subsp. amara]|uniref:Histone-lysine N-methyltransferase, H3 lysine-9 specific SUVH7 n=1 Tax=Cardamine amara subsp. amara TaxID=228776 RepID=A0ABD1C1W3_CARAN